MKIVCSRQTFNEQTKISISWAKNWDMDLGLRLVNNETSETSLRTFIISSYYYYACPTVIKTTIIGWQRLHLNSEIKLEFEESDIILILSVNSDQAKVIDNF